MKKNFQPIHDEHNIKGFFNEYEFLSNFYLCPVEYDGILYPSSENAYQAQKTLDIEERKKFINITPNESKKLGRKVKLREDWETIIEGRPNKVVIMSNIVASKFLQNNLKELLIQTGDKHLEESNWWRDSYWGTYNDEGENWLGRILMRLRTMLNIVHRPRQ